MKTKTPLLLLNLKIMKASIISRLLLIFFISVFSGCSSDSGGLSGADWNFDNLVGDMPTTVSRCWTVIDRSTELPIEAARLIVEFNGNLETRTLLTDTNGYVCTSFLDDNIIRQISISATGYQTIFVHTGASATFFLTPL